MLVPGEALGFPPAIAGAYGTPTMGQALGLELLGVVALNPVTRMEAHF